MSVINTDLSIQRSWYARKGFNNQFAITFTNSGSFDISAYTFVLNIRKTGDSSNLLQLTQGSGLTNGGATGILNVQVTAAQTASLATQSYYFEINYTVSGLLYGLMHGTLNLISQYNNENINESITLEVNLSGTEVTMEVNLAGNPLSVFTDDTLTTLTPTTYDAYELTAQASALTIANPSTDYANFDGFQVRFYTASAQTLTLGNKYRAQGEAFPASTTAGKVHILTAIRDSSTDKYDTKISIEV